MSLAGPTGALEWGEEEGPDLSDRKAGPWREGTREVAPGDKLKSGGRAGGGGGGASREAPRIMLMKFSRYLSCAPLCTRH